MGLPVFISLLLVYFCEHLCATVVLDSFAYVQNPFSFILFQLELRAAQVDDFTRQCFLSIVFCFRYLYKKFNSMIVHDSECLEHRCVMWMRVQMVGVETIMTGIMDTWQSLVLHWQYRVLAVMGVCAVGFLLGIPCTTQVVIIYAIELATWFLAFWKVLDFFPRLSRKVPENTFGPGKPGNWSLMSCKVLENENPGWLMNFVWVQNKQGIVLSLCFGLHSVCIAWSIKSVPILFFE